VTWLSYLALLLPTLGLYQHGWVIWAADRYRSVVRGGRAYPTMAVHDASRVTGCRIQEAVLSLEARIGESARARSLVMPRLFARSSSQVSHGRFVTVFMSSLSSPSFSCASYLPSLLLTPWLALLLSEATTAPTKGKGAKGEDGPATGGEEEAKDQGRPLSLLFMR
jgi:hypothetical protein